MQIGEFCKICYFIESRVVKIKIEFDQNLLCYLSVPCKVCQCSRKLHFEALLCNLKTSYSGGRCFHISYFRASQSTWKNENSDFLPMIWLEFHITGPNDLHWSRCVVMCVNAFTEWSKDPLMKSSFCQINIQIFKVHTTPQKE